MTDRRVIEKLYESLVVNKDYVGNTDLLRKYDELEQEIILLTGCNLIRLKELFAAGYTLKPPKIESLKT